MLQWIGPAAMVFAIMDALLNNRCVSGARQCHEPRL